MARCPNCNAGVEAAARVCPACSADFGDGSAWLPVGETPDELSVLASRQAQRVSAPGTAERIPRQAAWRLVVGALVIACAVALMELPAVWPHISVALLEASLPSGIAFGLLVALFPRLGRAGWLAGVLACLFGSVALPLAAGAALGLSGAGIEAPLLVLLLWAFFVAWKPLLLGAAIGWLVQRLLFRTPKSPVSKAHMFG
jgi:hypothetical protein